MAVNQQEGKATRLEICLAQGAQIARKELHDRWGGVRQGGVSPSGDTPNVFLFTDPAANQAHAYRLDRWVAPDLFEYCGERQRGDQSIVRYNRSVYQARTDGKQLHLFSGWRHLVTYVGPFELSESEPYFFDTVRDIDGHERRVLVFRLRPVGFLGTADTPLRQRCAA